MIGQEHGIANKVPVRGGSPAVLVLPVYHFFMQEITPDNAAEFARAHGWIGPGPVQAESLGGGVSNVVLRVLSGDQTLVLKQSRRQLRTRDAWFSDLDRVYREQEVMKLLQPLLPELTVPQVLHVDRANYVFAMSHAPADARVWKADLLAGTVDMKVAERAGSVLGTMHETTAKAAPTLTALADASVFIQLRVDPFYRCIQKRRPEVGPAVGRIVDRMLSTSNALCHGDYSPKNILVHARGFTLVDYETAHLGDPSMDLGFFLSHIILKAVKNSSQRDQFFELTRTFWRAYEAAVSFLPLDVLESRAVEHFGVCLLARIDGTSPVDYLPEEPKRQTVRVLGKTVLLDGRAKWEEVLELCEQHLSVL
jgi:aminoglycoside phosphotransferase (APT) family kinase protein